jgi:hypothetical protein
MKFDRSFSTFPQKSDTNEQRSRLICVPGAKSTSAPADNPASTPDNANPASSNQTRAEILRLWRSDFSNDGDIRAGNRTYLAQVIAARTGMSPADAEKRVDSVVIEAKTAAYSSLAAWRPHPNNHPTRPFLALTRYQSAPTAHFCEIQGKKYVDRVDSSHHSRSRAKGNGLSDSGDMATN